MSERTVFASDDSLTEGEIYTTYQQVSTNAAIADAKREYAESHDIDKDQLRAKKLEQGWDNKRDSVYRSIIVVPRYEARLY